MKAKNQDKIQELKIKSELSLQRFLLNKWLELIESGKDNHKIIALRELSKYSFPSNKYTIPVKKVLNDEDSFLNF